MTFARSRGYKRYALGVMTAVYTLNLTDRGLMSLLLQPIKDDLHLTDTQLGFVTGIVFGLFYATLGLPIARWADRGNRVTITSFAIGLWGLTVAACLLVTTYSQLVAARIAAAVGEAGCKPPTYSLLGDYFPGAVERTRAMGVYWLGSPLGALLSYVLGGWLNERYGWRLTFVVMGVAGVLLAAVVRWTIAEPRANLSNVSEHKRSPSMRAVLAVLWQRRSCRHLGIALILLYAMGAGMSPWYAAFMMRTHGMGTGELGLWLGMIFGLSGALGTLLGGYIANRWFAQDVAGQMRMSAIGVGLLTPSFVAFLLLPQRHAALIALTPIPVVFCLCLAPTYALMQRLVPDDMRATTIAVVMLLANLVGMGVGPQIVGISSDLLTPALGQDALRYAMLILSLVGLWAGLHFWKASGVVAGDLRVTELAA